MRESDQERTEPQPGKPLGIVVGSDHPGYEVKCALMAALEGLGHRVTDVGPDSPETCDYPDYAERVAAAVSAGEADRGALVCGSGIGMSIVANKFPGVRAALCADAYSAHIAKLANNANVIVLGMRLTGETHAKEIVDSWLETEPATEPRRVNFHRKTDKIDDKYRKV